MEPLLKQLRKLPTSFLALPARTRWALVAAVVIAGLLALTVTNLHAGDEYQYAFTNLSPEDSAEATTLLIGAGVEHRLEAGGTALAVPANKVYDVRLLLAAAGLPRGGGIGFELFDKGDLGVSEFTRKVNLRRALEGELARTIGRLSEVRSARVHLTLEEKTLFRDADRKASAAVVLNLKAGMVLEEKELAGIRHLVASAVPGLTIEGVTIVDGRGAVLSTQESSGQTATAHQRAMEQDLEHRLVTLLEPVAGTGAVIARVTALLDDTEVSTSAEVYDPETTALRTDRKATQNQQQETGSQVPGAAATATTNSTASPATATATTPLVGNRNTNTSNDESHTYEISKTVTTTVVKNPRLKRLSVAILVDGLDGKPRPDDEIKRLGDLARRAVGFDALRGDQLEISSVAFTKSPEETSPVVAASRWTKERIALAATGTVLALVVLALVAAVVSARRRRPPLEIIAPGVRVVDAQAALDGRPVPALPSLPPASRDPDATLRDRARELASLDPTRAMYLMRAWVATDAKTDAGGARV